MRALYAWYVEPQAEPFLTEVAGPSPSLDIDAFGRYCRMEAALWVHAEGAGVDGFVLLTSIQERMRVACVDWRQRHPAAPEAPASRELGVAIRDACAAAGVRKAQALCLAGDARRLAMAESFGMQREGLLRAHFYHAGVYHDLVMLGWRAEDARE